MAKPAALAVAAMIGAWLLFTAPASADVFSFSTGVPDGKIGTLSGLSSPGQIETETADDFLITNCVVIHQATFTGLLPSGAPLTSITNVEIEFYHVFPADTAFPLSGNVPTRTNSPADVEIDSATRDGLAGSLSFTATLVSSNFTATNSVVNGIHKSPNQTTRGEGTVTGEEVLLTVTFHPPVALPPDHYFFRPQALLSSGNFLWLSAPRPIVAPGTPFTNDLQTWIRNADLAPDWLRIGTDIIGTGAFDAAFSLLGETDSDCDGVGDSEDQCSGTPSGAIVNAEGCTIDQLAPCAGPASGGTWKNHGQYVSTVAHVAVAFLMQGLITEEQLEAIISHAARSGCGFKAHPPARPPSPRGRR